MRCGRKGMKRVRKNGKKFEILEHKTKERKLQNELRVLKRKGRERRMKR